MLFKAHFAIARRASQLRDNFSAWAIKNTMN